VTTITGHLNNVTEINGDKERPRFRYLLTRKDGTRRGIEDRRVVNRNKIIDKNTTIPASRMVFLQMKNANDQITIEKGMRQEYVNYVYT